MEYCFFILLAQGQTASVRICIRVRCRFKSAWPVSTLPYNAYTVVYGQQSSTYQNKKTLRDWTSRSLNESHFIGWLDFCFSRSHDRSTRSISGSMQLSDTIDKSYIPRCESRKRFFPCYLRTVLTAGMNADCVLFPLSTRRHYQHLVRYRSMIVCDRRRNNIDLDSRRYALN